MLIIKNLKSLSKTKQLLAISDLSTKLCLSSRESKHQLMSTLNSQVKDTLLSLGKVLEDLVLNIIHKGHLI